MSQRASLPSEAVTITPGYTWRLDLDVAFDGERPTDWPDWQVRMHFWAPTGPLFTLTNGSGVSFDSVDDLPDATGPVTLPVIEMTAAQTEQMRGLELVQYLIDLKAPAGDAEDYFTGPIRVVPSPPAEMLQ